MVFLNLTPHSLTLVGDDGNRLVIPSSGVARLAIVTGPLGCIEGYPLMLQEVGDVAGLPEPQPGVVYIVSALVAQAVASRADVVRRTQEPVPSVTVRAVLLQCVVSFGSGHTISRMADTMMEANEV